jgi:hypothetical protein
MRAARIRSFLCLIPLSVAVVHAADNRERVPGYADAQDEAKIGSLFPPVRVPEAAIDDFGVWRNYLSIIDDFGFVVWRNPIIINVLLNCCDLGPPLGLLEANLRAVADSSRMTAFADTLAALRPTKP